MPRLVVSSSLSRMSVRSPSRSRSMSRGERAGLVRQSATTPRTRFVQGLVIRAWKMMLSCEFRKETAAPTDSSRSAILIAPSFRVPLMRRRAVSSARPDFPEGADDVPARMLPWTAAVGLFAFLYRRHLIPGPAGCSSTSFARSVSRPMVVPYANTSAHCPVLHGQVFRGYLRDLRWRYLLQFLNKPSHGFEGRDHFEDAYHEALSGDAVKRIRVLSFDLRDRPLKLMLAGRSFLNLLNFLHQNSLSSINRNALPDRNVQCKHGRIDGREELRTGFSSQLSFDKCLVQSGASTRGLAGAECEEANPAQDRIKHHQPINVLASKPGRMICYFDVVSLRRDSNLNPPFTRLRRLSDCRITRPIALGQWAEVFLDLGKNLLWRERTHNDEQRVPGNVVASIVFEEIVSRYFQKVCLQPSLRPSVRVEPEG